MYFDITYTGDWEYYSNTVPPGINVCGCQFDFVEAGSGPASGKAAIVEAPWFHDTKDCADCYISIVDSFTFEEIWPDHVVCTSFDFVPDPDSNGMLQINVTDSWPATTEVEIEMGPHSFLTGNNIDNTKCCNCAGGAGRLISTNVSDIEVAGWDYELAVEKDDFGDCSDTFCVFNRRPGTHTYTATYDRIVPEECCFNGATGLQVGLTTTFDLDGPGGYAIVTEIDAAPLDGYNITAWGSFNVTAEFAEAVNNSINFVGRIGLKIYGIDCNDVATLEETHTLFRVQEGQNNDPCDCAVDVTGGSLAWTPCSTCDYKAFRFDWEVVASSFPGCGLGPIVDVLPPILTRSDTVTVDPGLFSCP